MECTEDVDMSCERLDKISFCSPTSEPIAVTICLAIRRSYTDRFDNTSASESSPKSWMRRERRHRLELMSPGLGIFPRARISLSCEPPMAFWRIRLKAVTHSMRKTMPLRNITMPTTQDTKASWRSTERSGANAPKMAIMRIRQTLMVASKALRAGSFQGQVISCTNMKSSITETMRSIWTYGLSPASTMAIESRRPRGNAKVPNHQTSVRNRKSKNRVAFKNHAFPDEAFAGAVHVAQMARE
mmetsp:Transcript_21681/g.50273  ORF Transcript_21681/g.50273 Transcript_21681/m.50273 type:complete len:243 (-) Transcript_21681:930-1658(-)